MLEAFEVTHLHTGDETLDVVLSFEERQKSRHRVSTTCGNDVGWFIERGRILQQDDVLKCSDGTLIRITAADEAVSDVRADTHLQLMRAAYHLGNRHVPLQVNAEFLRYQQDHVLDQMVEGLGLRVLHVEAPFQPENGAYSGGHSHSHEHSHAGHEHSHEHE